MNLVFESERLIFRPLSADDVDLEIEMWTDPEVTRYITGQAAKEQDVKGGMPKFVQRAGNGCIGIWTLTTNATDEKIGHAVLLPMPVSVEDTEWDLLGSDQLPDRDIEIGYVLKRSAWGNGYATEACSRLLNFAFTATDRQVILATTDANNEASKRVLKKCGMTSMGRIMAYAEQVPGFQITRSAWQAKIAKQGARSTSAEPSAR